METRSLGLSVPDLRVSILGLGTVKFGRNVGVKYPKPFALPDDERLREIVRIAADGGINLLDTAPAYGESESRLGHLMTIGDHAAADDTSADTSSQHRPSRRSAKWGWGGRDRWVLATKVGESFDAATGQSSFDFRPDAVRLSVERSLLRLRTDHLDVVLVHSDGRDVEIIEHEGTLQALADLKSAGLLRAFGMSTKTVVGGHRAIEAGCDVVMLTWNPQHTDEGPVIDAAREAGCGVLVKKALLSGHVAEAAASSGDAMGTGLEAAPGAGKASAAPPDTAACLRFAIQRDGVTSVVVGTRKPANLTRNIAVVKALN